MPQHLGKSIARFFFLEFLMFSAVCLTLSALTQSQNSNNQKQQRPRTVGQSNSNSQQTNSKGEEVDEGDIVRVETQLVSVPAVVTDRNGHPITGLHLENFLVLEDGKAQKLTNFATTETPFEIALLLDTSGSTRDDIGLIRDAANAFIDALRPGDRVAIVAFKNSTRNGIPTASADFRSPLTDNREALRVAIADIGTSNGTPFYDTLGQIGRQSFTHPPRVCLRCRR